MAASAFNAFLKTLEEPPRHAIFILATTEKHKILPTILSRCQIYDFSRIGVEDTVAHLAYVASKEGITAEPEALNVIALKADGGMRDALSIFDQVVSFTGGHITYKSVIENLNVLDYEYYFKLTGFFLENKISDALLLLNDVLNKGFDGSHFITGLSSHLRDLLVSKDPATLPLLEVGASIRERYQAQAQQCPLPFLYRAMKLCNDCDLNYRASKNKRLLVELTLIQVAQLTAEEDDGANGRSPKQAIKPIFTQPAAAQQPQATAAMPQQTVQPAVQTNSTPQPAATQHSNATTPHATPAAVLMAQGREEKKIPVMKMSGLGVSIKRPHIEEEQRNPSSNPTAAHQAAQPEEDYIFNERDLNYYWQEYAGRMPKEQVAIAKRMQNMRITLINDTTFEAVVDNEIVAKEFTGMTAFKAGFEMGIKAGERYEKDNPKRVDRDHEREGEEKYLAKDALPALLANAKAEAEKNVMERVKKLNAAANACAFALGNVDAMAYDSAEDIYARVLQAKGIDTSKYPKESYKAMVDVLQKQRFDVTHANDEAIKKFSVSSEKTPEYMKNLKNITIR